MTDNLINSHNKLAARKKTKHALIDELIADYKKHQRLMKVLTFLKISLNAGLKYFDGLEKQIELKEEKLIKMCVGTEAVFLKNVLRG